MGNRGVNKERHQQSQPLEKLVNRYPILSANGRNCTISPPFKASWEKVYSTICITCYTCLPTVKLTVLGASFVGKSSATSQFLKSPKNDFYQAIPAEEILEDNPASDQDRTEILIDGKKVSLIIQDAKVR